MAASPAPVRHAGIDVSKATRDVWILPDEEGFVVANTPTGFATLVARLEELGSVLIVREATGSYHRKVTIALDAAGFTPAVINPRWLHSVGRGQGQRAKTDQGDARLLAAYAQREGAWLLDTLRRWLRAAGIARMTLETVRLRLLKIEGWVRERRDRVWLRLATSHPNEAWWHALATRPTPS